MNPSFAIFETGLGWMGLVWRGRAVIRVLMPQSSRAAIERSVERFSPDAADRSAALPAHIETAVSLLQRYADGEQVDFSGVAVDAGEVGQMRAAIYAVLRKVPYGQTLTYGELAARAGYAGMARDIGEAMGKNPTPIIVPCHRVVAAGGKLGGFSAPGGATTKRGLLELENARPAATASPQSSFAF